ASPWAEARGCRAAGPAGNAAQAFIFGPCPTDCGMLGTAQRDVWKTWLYALAAAALGAWLAPWLFNAGKALADVAGGKETNDVLDRLANVCRAAEFPAFYQTALLVAAALLFFPWMHWLGSGRSRPRVSTAPWTMRLPHCAPPPSTGQPLNNL